MPFLKIIRPVNCLFTMICVFAGAWHHASANLFWPVFFAALAAGTIAAGGYVINDVFDLEIDRINRPHRVLPSGQLSSVLAKRYALLLFAIGIAAAAGTGSTGCMLIAVLNTALLYLYAKNLKTQPVIGNITVAYAAASVFFFGGLASGNLTSSLSLAYFSFFFTLARELVKDAQDIEGDKAKGARTLAIMAGTHIALFTALASSLIMLAGVWFFRFSITAKLLMFALAGLPLTGSLIYLNARSSKKNFAYISNLMKLDMFIVLIIVWIG
jgi:geranylgeranylglycerol-phosphate geranylgeranyltransferase